MDEAERRKLVFANLLNGAPVPHVMQAFRMSALEVERDFQFVATKVRSYRFERGMPLFPLTTVEEAKAHRIEVLWTMQRVNLGKPAQFTKIETLPFEPGQRGPAEQKLLEIQLSPQGKHA